MPTQETFIEIANDRRDHVYFTQIPNILWFLDISHADFKLYNTFVKTCGWGQGKQCYKSTRYLAAEAGLSSGQISSSKNSLLKAGLITRDTKKRSLKGRAVDHIRLVDIWPVNMRFFEIHKSNDTHLRFSSIANIRQHLRSLTERKCSVNERECSVSERKCSVSERKRSVSEPEEDHFKKITEEKQVEEAAAKKPKPEPSPFHPDQSDWTDEDHASLEVILYSWTKKFGKLTASQVEKMITLWNLYPEEEIHEYAWNEMIEARDKRKVQPNLTYYEKCLATEARTNWVLNEGGNGRGA